MDHPDCSCCANYPCERCPDIWQNCMMFELAPGVKAIPPIDWRPDWSQATPGVDRYVGLDACYDRWEREVQSATGDSVYPVNAFEI